MASTNVSEKCLIFTMYWVERHTEIASFLGNRLKKFKTEEGFRAVLEFLRKSDRSPLNTTVGSTGRNIETILKLLLQCVTYRESSDLSTFCFV
jgi:hypothetical protein